MKNYCIANWKMNFTTKDSIKFLDKFLKKNLDNSKSQIIFCPSFISMKDVKKRLLSYQIPIAAQNVHQAKNGSFTGEVSVDMLKEIECEWVILGHSERRQFFGEEDVILNDKLNSVLESGLNPILCIGENIEQRESNQTLNVLSEQIDKAFFNINLKHKEIIIAYEPVWAIGTGKSADVEIIEETVNWICEYLLQKYSIKIPILYGGSVSKTNCLSMMNVKNLNGFLIGTSSLNVSEFYAIYSIMGER